MRNARNVLIIVALAAVVAFVPGGGNAADTLLTAISMAFLAGISWMLYTLSRENQLTLATLTESRRALLYGAVGMLAFLVAGFDKLEDTAGGTLLLIVLFAASVAAIWRVWVEANTY